MARMLVMAGVRTVARVLRRSVRCRVSCSRAGFQPVRSYMLVTGAMGMPGGGRVLTRTMRPWVIVGSHGGF